MTPEKILAPTESLTSNSISMFVTLFHLLVWKQNGTLANSGAWFFAVSKEKNLRRHHTIDHDGYNVGRDLLVEAAIKGGVWKTWQWKAKVEWVDGLLEMGRHGEFSFEREFFSLTGC